MPYNVLNASGALPMPVYAAQTTAFSPSAVSIHDYRYMHKQLSLIQYFKYFRLIFIKAQASFKHAQKAGYTVLGFFETSQLA